MATKKYTEQLEEILGKKARGTFEVSSVIKSIHDMLRSFEDLSGENTFPHRNKINELSSNYNRLQENRAENPTHEQNMNAWESNFTNYTTNLYAYLKENKNQTSHKEDNKQPQISESRLTHQTPVQNEVISATVTNTKKKEKSDTSLKISKKSNSEMGAFFVGLNLQKRYTKNNFTLNMGDLTIGRAEIIALVGQNGQGKTTLMEIIAGKIKPTGVFPEYPAFKTKKWYDIKSDIVYIPQKIKSWNGTLEENLQFASSVEELKGEENQLAVDEVCNFLNIEKYKKCSWNEISGGYKVLFELAKALIKNPKLLLLDEPLANLDMIAQLTFLEKLKDLAKSPFKNMAIVISSQHIHEVEAIADKIIFLEDGKAKFKGLKDAIISEQPEYNYFEVDSIIDKNVFEQTIYNLGNDISIKRKGGYKYIIRTSKDINEELILNEIKDKNIAFSLFRNITSSTKKLFDLW